MNDEDNNKLLENAYLWLEDEPLPRTPEFRHLMMILRDLRERITDLENPTPRAGVTVFGSRDKKYPGTFGYHFSRDRS